MPPKKNKGQADQSKPEANGQKKKKKILPKGEGMGGTIGYTDKEEKNRCMYVLNATGPNFLCSNINKNKKWSIFLKFLKINF